MWRFKMFIFLKVFATLYQTLMPTPYLHGSEEQTLSPFLSYFKLWDGPVATNNPTDTIYGGISSEYNI